ncbi:MAG: beta-ketoacyl-ACP synthase II [Acidobacteriaceae bacterium]|nr:beta-ketoacyl-ACP synthase II [Acidobacteriaceae bacterium]MBV9781717.1 beta-ketoacyl-ACP synthase II [Acidobacteriaceae bacterium]
MPRRVVVTGIGLLSSVGSGTEECWSAIRNGNNGIELITQFDASEFSCRIAGEVKNFDPLLYVDKKDVKKMGRFIQFAMAATEFAVNSASLKVTPAESERVGVYIGSGIGGFEVIEREHKTLLERGPSRISPFFIPSCIVNLASGYVSIRYEAKGPNSATATACTTSAHSIGDSFRLIQHNYADVMICGGSEACVTPMGIGGFAAMRALSTRNDEPRKASRPWDKKRDGFVVGEGSGILILEELGHAKRRDAPILTEIVGYGMSADAFHITSPPDDGEGGYRVMRNALCDARLDPSQVQYVNAHGTSTGLGDRAETIAVKRAFGVHAGKVAVSSTKSMTGHLLGGAGGLEAGITVLAIRDQIAPPTINYEFPDPECDLDYVPNHARAMQIEYALSNSFGFGGTNGCLIFKRFEE